MKITTQEELEAFIPLIGDYEDVRTALEAMQELGCVHLRPLIMEQLEQIESCQ